jgi:hypothetical protein
MPVYACKQLLLQLVKGECLIKFKTDPVDPFYAPYWEGRARFFEFQVRCGRGALFPQGAVSQFLKFAHVAVL